MFQHGEYLPLISKEECILFSSLSLPLQSNLLSQTRKTLSAI